MNVELDQHGQSIEKPLKYNCVKQHHLDWAK